MKVIEKTVEILNAATNGSDQELDEAVTRLHPRAKEMAEWLEFMQTAPGSAWSRVASRRRSARRKGSATPLPREPSPNHQPLNRQGILNPRRETHQRARLNQEKRERSESQEKEQ